MQRNPFGQKSRVGRLPAPIGGLNAHDGLPDMAATDAIKMENWIPEPGGVSLRKGHSSWTTGLGASVESLMEYHNQAGTKTLFGAAGTDIFVVTSAGAVGAASLGSLTNARWQNVMFSTSGGTFLVIANGADSVRNYNGSSWSTPSITGVTSANLINVTVHMNRLWFVEKDSLSIWYLGTSAISGAATEIDFGSLCRKGGSLAAMGSWTRDGGAGADDLAVFVTTRGEVLLYSGTDPASADTWALVGVFEIPEPIGYRCLAKSGADLAVLTSQGLMSLSTILPVTAAGKARTAATNKIQGEFNRAYRAYGTTYGWSVVEYPKGGLIIVNVPTGSTNSIQYVMNVETAAWCKFTGLNARCWSLLGDALFLGKANGSTYKYDVSYIDIDTPVEGVLLPAFSSFGSVSNKQFTMARPLYSAVTGTNPPLILKTNYDISDTSVSIPDVPAAGAVWDSAPWDTSSWEFGTESISEWQALSGSLGQTVSIELHIASQTSITLNHIDVMYTEGGAL